MPLCIVMIPVLLRQKYRKRRRKSILKSKRKIHHLYYGHVIKTFKNCQQCIKTKTKTVWYLRSHFWRRYRNKGTIPLAQFSFTFLGGDVLQKKKIYIYKNYIYTVYHIVIIYTVIYMKYYLFFSLMSAVRILTVFLFSSRIDQTSLIIIIKKAKQKHKYGI